MTLYPAKAGIATAKNEKEVAEEVFDWTPVIEAIIHVESGGDDNAIGAGNAVGAMQITPILIKEVNLILKRRGLEGSYSLDDRFSREKSIEMFYLIQSYFNPNNDVEQAIRAWNGGMGYTKAGTERYYTKVTNRMASDAKAKESALLTPMEIIKQNIHYDNRNNYFSSRCTARNMGC